MILQAVERIATWLGNGTHGVNALLPSVPRIGADTQPANVTILDERQHPSAARHQFKRDQTFPVLVVQLAEDSAMDVSLEAGVRDAPDVAIAISYAIAKKATDDGARSSYYTMVAVEQSLKRLWTNGAASDRTQGAVSLVIANGLRHLKLFTQVGDVMITTGIIARYFVRDAAP